MAEVVLHSDTKETEFGHLTSLDLELNSLILDLVYLSCLSFEYGTVGKIYLYEYGAEISRVDYQNPLDIYGFFKNVSKKSIDFVLARTIFFKEEQAKRRAQAEKEQAEAEKAFQSAADKKLKNAERAYKFRQKIIRDGATPDEANQLIAQLLQDQRARLALPPPK
jgi:hypothetical protein